VPQVPDIRNAHPCCLIGCYADDRLKRNTNDENMDTNDNVDDERNVSNTNICSTILNTVFNPVGCGMAIQCCGVCAIAQEGREVDRVLLPPSYRRIDYITMEPFLSYYPAIYQHKMKTINDSPSPMTDDVNATTQNNTTNTTTATAHKYCCVGGAFFSNLSQISLT
jgi:hypothetical protein